MQDESDIGQFLRFPGEKCKANNSRWKLWSSMQDESYISNWDVYLRVPAKKEAINKKLWSLMIRWVGYMSKFCKKLNLFRVPVKIIALSPTKFKFPVFQAPCQGDAYNQLVWNCGIFLLNLTPYLSFQGSCQDDGMSEDWNLLNFSGFQQQKCSQRSNEGKLQAFQGSCFKGTAISSPHK